MEGAITTEGDRVLTAGMVRATGALGEPLAAVARDEAFRSLVERDLDASYRLAGVILGSAVEAEDAVHDAALAAWSRFDSLHDRERFDAWFGRILVNGCRDRIRRRRTITFVPFAPELMPAQGPDELAAAADRLAVGQALDALDADHRVTVVLRYWADLSVDAIAERLDIPAGTVKSRLHHALRRLRGALMEEREG